MTDAAYVLVAFAAAALAPLSLLCHVFFFGRTRWLRLHLGSCVIAILAVMAVPFWHRPQAEMHPCREVGCALPPEE